MADSETLAQGTPRVTRHAEPDAIVVQDVHKRFPSPRSIWQTLRHPGQREWVESLQGVSFSVAHGEFFGILGPNGAGKTTLFKCITGLVTPERGQLTLQGHDVQRATR